MKIGKIMTIALGIGASGLLLSSANAAVQSIPFADSFEGLAVGNPPTDPYVVAGTGTVLADDTLGNLLTGAGDQVIEIKDVATLTLPFTPATYPNVWVQIYAKPVTGATAPSATGESGAFYVADGGQVRVYDGFADSWADADPTTITPGAWVGFIAHIDYVADKWDLYLTEGDYLSDASMIASQVGMPLGDEITEFSVYSGDPGYIDALAVSEGGTQPVGVSSPDSVAVATFGGGADLSDFALPVYPSAWAVSPADRSLPPER